MDLPGLVVPGLVHHLFSASQAAQTGLATIIDCRPRLEQGRHILPLQQLNNIHYLFSIDLDFILAPATSRPSRNTTALSVLKVPADLWHRRMGHVYSKNLRILRGANDNGINSSDSMSHGDVYAFGKSKQERHPKTTATIPFYFFSWYIQTFLAQYRLGHSGGLFTSASSQTNTARARKSPSSERTSMLLTNPSNSSIPSYSREGCASSVFAQPGGGEYTVAYVEKTCLDKDNSRVCCHEHSSTERGVRT